MDLVDFSRWFILAAVFLLTQVSTGIMFDMKPSTEKFLPRYDLYHNLSRMNECLRDISAQYSDLLNVEMGYHSRLGLAQYVLHITNFSSHNTNTPARVDRRSKILLSYGEHAAEFFPVQSMFHLLQNITRGYNLPIGTYGRNFTEFVLNNIDLYVVTIVNPDGRIAIEATKNHCWIGTANNIDLNTDLGVTSGNKRQTRIIAEPECRVIRELTSQQSFDAFVSFHSGQRRISFPYPGQISKPPGSNDVDVFYLASIISSTMKLDFSIVPINNSAIGDSILAYVSQEKKIPFTYKLSLWASKKKKLQRPNSQCFGFYNPPNENLKAELEAVHPIYPALFHYINYWKELQRYNEAEENARIQGLKARSGSYVTVIFIIIMGCTGIYLACNLRVPSTWKMYFRRQRRIVSLRTLGTVFSFLSVS